jgi:hypothetical protein
VNVLVLAILARAGERRRTARDHFLLHEPGIVLVPVLADLVVDLEPLEVLLQDEVDDARDRIGAVHGGRPAGHDIHAFEQHRRDLVEVGRRLLDRRVGRADAESTAVHQHERAVRAEAAQVRGRDPACGRETAGAVAEVLSERVVEVLRQLIDDITDVHAAAERDFLRRHDLDRARALEVRRGNAGAGDHHFLWGRGLVLRERRGGGSRCNGNTH